MIFQHLCINVEFYDVLPWNLYHSCETRKNVPGQKKVQFGRSWSDNCFNSYFFNRISFQETSSILKISRLPISPVWIQFSHSAKWTWGVLQPSALAVCRTLLNPYSISTVWGHPSPCAVPVTSMRELFSSGSDNGRSASNREVLSPFSLPFVSFRSFYPFFAVYCSPNVAISENVQSPSLIYVNSS